MGYERSLGRLERLNVIEVPLNNKLRRTTLMELLRPHGYIMWYKHDIHLPNPKYPSSRNSKLHSTAVFKISQFWGRHVALWAKTFLHPISECQLEYWIVCSHPASCYCTWEDRELRPRCFGSCRPHEGSRWETLIPGLSLARPHSSGHFGIISVDWRPISFSLSHTLSLSLYLPTRLMSKKISWHFGET